MRVRHLLAIAAGLALLLAPSTAAAQSAPNGVIVGEEVVVTATRTHHKLADVPANVTVLTAKDVERSPALTVDDLLRQLPGFNLLRQSSSLVSHPATQAVSLRGLGGTSASRTLVLLDGVPLNDPFTGFVYWSRVPLESIERIEVVRGGGSGIWGNRALGGVIHIITKSPDRRAASVAFEGGSHGTRSLFAAASEARGPLRLSVFGRDFDTEGYDIVDETQRGPIDVRSSSEHRTAGGKLEYDLSSTATLNVQGSLFSDERHHETRLQESANDIASLRAGLDVATSGGSAWQATLFTSTQDYESRFSSTTLDRTSETPSSDQFHVPAALVGTNVQWSKALGARHRLTAGGDVQWIEGETNEDFRFITNAFTRRRRAGGEQLTQGVYVQEIFTPAPRWQVVAAARVDVWRSMDASRVERDLQTGEVLLDASFPDRSAVAVNPTLGALYHATDRVSLRGSAYHGVRTPTLDELFRPFRASGNIITESNQALDHERLTGAEIGADYAVAPTFLGRLTAFWNVVEDPITNVTIGQTGSAAETIEPCGLVPPGGVCRQRQNLGSLRTRGVEASVEAWPHPSWLLAASYLFDDAEVLSAPGHPQLVGNEVVQVPRHQFVIQVGYANPDLIEASLQGRYVGDRFDDDLNVADLGEFFVLDLRLARRFSHRWTASLAVENLFDTTYEVSKAPGVLTRTGGPILVHGGIRVQL